ncbi:MAG: hypothetical protein ACU843_14610 [Gammaproteobacteria bacterium]
MKKLIACYLMSLFGALTFTQNALAHTTFTDRNGVEGSSLRTNMSISHGCADQSHVDEGGDELILSVMAQAAVFPNLPDSEATIDGTEPPQPISMATVIENANGGRGVLDLRVYQDRNIFNTIRVLRDDLNNRHAVRYTNETDGILDFDLPGLNVDTAGLVPVQLSFGRFRADSCVKKITVRIPIANYCHDRTGIRRADIWLGILTPVFNDPNIVSVGFWPTVDINRAEDNPLPENCGDGMTVTLQPSVSDIDANLPIEGFHPSAPPPN